MCDLTIRRLAVLYNETDNKIQKKRYFLELKKRLEKETNKIVRYWVYLYSKKPQMFDKFQNYHQIADIELVKTLDKFPSTNDEFNFRSWYLKMLYYRLSTENKNTTNKDSMIYFVPDYELLEDEASDFKSSYNFSSMSYTTNLDSGIDNSNFRNIILVKLENIIRSVIKDKKQLAMFKLFYGLTKSRKTYTLDSIAKRFGFSRQYIGQANKRNLDRVIKKLEQEGNLEELRQLL